MLTITGTLEQVLTTGGARNGKGELVPVRHCVQLRVQEANGRFRYVDLYTDDPEPFRSQEGAQVTLPVRAWASEGRVNFSLSK